MQKENILIIPQEKEKNGRLHEVFVFKSFSEFLNKRKEKREKAESREIVAVVIYGKKLKVTKDKKQWKLLDADNSQVTAFWCIRDKEKKVNLDLIQLSKQGKMGNTKFYQATMSEKDFLNHPIGFINVPIELPEEY